MVALAHSGFLNVRIVYTFESPSDINTKACDHIAGTHALFCHIDRQDMFLPEGIIGYFFSEAKT